MKSIEVLFLRMFIAYKQAVLSCTALLESWIYVLVCCVYWSGMLKDDVTLRDIKLTKGAKMMVIGSTIQDVLTVGPPLPESTKPSSSTTTSKESKFITSVLDKENTYRGSKWDLIVVVC